jgi:uncharacterized protein (DUF1499 family)
MAGVRDFWVRAALVLALALPVYFAGAALATKFDLLDWRVGFGLLTFQIGPLAVMGVLGFAVLGLVLALLVPPRRGALVALMAALIPGAFLGYGAYARSQSADIPAIHDISTDRADPPAFSQAVLAARSGVPGANPTDARGVPLKEHPSYAKRMASPMFAPLGERTVNDLQAEAYPDIAPIALTKPPAEAFAAAEAAAAAQGWTITTVDAGAGVIEAQAESFWFGFIDDVVIRVRPSVEGAVVDVRSVSRVGLSDIGANARRIRAFRESLIAS